MMEEGCVLSMWDDAIEHSKVSCFRVKKTHSLEFPKVLKKGLSRKKKAVILDSVCLKIGKGFLQGGK